MVTVPEVNLENKLPENSPTMPFEFQTAPKLVSCSANVCPSGHEWTPMIQITGCPGCKGPLAALKMEQCPVCNEPPVRLRLRIDHLPVGGSIMPMCRGSETLAEVQVVELIYQHYVQEQAKHVERALPDKL